MTGPQVKLFQFFSSQVERQDVSYAWHNIWIIKIYLTQSDTDIRFYDVTHGAMSDLLHWNQGSN